MASGAKQVDATAHLVLRTPREGQQLGVGGDRRPDVRSRAGCCDFPYHAAAVVDEIRRSRASQWRAYPCLSGAATPSPRGLRRRCEEQGRRRGLLQTASTSLVALDLLKLGLLLHSPTCGSSRRRPWRFR